MDQSNAIPDPRKQDEYEGVKWVHEVSRGRSQETVMSE